MWDDDGIMTEITLSLNLSGDLVVINSEAEWKFLLKAVKDQGEDDEIYMGASAG